MEERKRYISDKTSRIVSIAITVCFILAFITHSELYLHFPNRMRTLYDIHLFVFSNMFVLLVKFIIIACLETRKMLYEFKSILLSLVLYTPIIFTTYSGWHTEFKHYTIFFSFCAFIWMLRDSFKRRSIDLISVLLMVLSLTIVVFPFLRLFNNSGIKMGVVQEVIYIFASIIAFTIGILLIIKEHFHLKQIIFAVSFLAILWIVFGVIKGPVLTYEIYSCAAVIILMLSCVQIKIRSKFKITGSFLLLLLMFQSLGQMISISIIRVKHFAQSTSLTSFTLNVNKEFLMYLSLLVILLLLEKHLIFNEQRRLSQ